MLLLFIKILFMLAIGSVFFKMASRFNANNWTIFILGVASFYGGTILFENCVALFIFFNPDITLIPNFNKLQVLITFPFAILVSLISYSVVEDQLKSNFIQKSSGLVRKFGN